MPELMVLVDRTLVGCVIHNLSHDGTVVPECYKDDVESQWKHVHSASFLGSSNSLLWYEQIPHYGIPELKKATNLHFKIKIRSR